MDIVFICTRSITFNTFLKSQANYFLKKGDRVNVVCQDIENLIFKKKLSFKISFPVNYFQIINIFKYIKIYFEIRELVKKKKSSVFYIHTPLASYIFRFFTFFDNLNLVYFVHGFRFSSNTNFLKNFFFKLIKKILSIRKNTIITINNEDYDYAKNNLLGKNISYKLNGVGLNKISRKKRINYKKKINKLIVIAAYKKSKGYLEILKIAESLNDSKLKIDCYGYGDFKKFEKIKLKKKLKNISFNKFDKNLKKKIKEYDLLIHMSEREGLPVSVMECLTEGLPVICKNIRGNNDLVKDGFNGFFVNSYKEAIFKIFYLNMENKIFNLMRINASKSITNVYSQKYINAKVYKILKNNIKLKYK